MKKVLVIEDSSEVRNLVSEILLAHGYDVLTAADGVEGIDLAESHRPDLVICDLCLPGLDGVGIWSRIREQPATAATPFVFLSGMADIPVTDCSWNPDRESFLRKPFALSELVGVVKLHLQAGVSSSAVVTAP